MSRVRRSGIGRALMVLMTVAIAPVIAVTGHPAAAASSVQAVSLRTENAASPLGIDARQPRLSWQLQSGSQDEAQVAYQIVVASTATAAGSGQGDVWDSGKQTSDQSVDVPYGGPPLRSSARYYWSVRVWDNHGQTSAWSAPAWWETGLLSPQDWSGAHWIGAPKSPAADPVSNTQWNYPAQLQSGHTLGQSFTVDGLFTGVAGAFPTWVTTGSGMTLTLRRNGPGGPEVASKTFGNVPDNSWQWLTFAAQPAGSYYLEMSVPVGTIGWWSDSGDVLPGGQAYADGQPAAGDRSLQIQVPSYPDPYVRHEFTVSKPVASARLYVTALGLYQAHLNGRRVGQDQLAPGWTDYHKRIQYQTYDVTRMVHPGQNVIGALLGTGWYAGQIAWLGTHIYGTQPWLLARLRLTYTDGTTADVTSDGSWRTAPSPVLSSDIYQGEDYDARKELPGWDRAGYNDAAWSPVAVNDTVSGQAQLVAQVGPSVREDTELRPVALTQPQPGHYVFDFGQNFAGWVRLTASGPSGTTVTLRHAEVLNPDGTIYTANLRSANATDTYTLNGRGTETFEPHFTYHGFRYVELTGFPGTPTLDTLTGIVAHAAATPSGQFSTSSQLVNQIQHNIVWGQKSNFYSVPTDCPQRDERLGWMGDAQIFAPTASFNMDLAGFYDKWTQDVEDAQRPDGGFTDVSPDVCCGEGTPGWGDAGVVVPYVVWQRYGDTQIIRTHWAAMQHWIDYLKANSTNLLRPPIGYGDWLNVNDDTPKDVIGTAYFAYSAELMAAMATAIGHSAEAAQYQQLFSQIRDAFDRAYVSPDATIRGDTQTAYVLALSMNLLPGSQRAAAAQHLVDHIKARGMHLSTGFLGTGQLLPVLTQTGHLDVAYALLEQTTFPSWGYEIGKGATTIWERWDGIKPDGSFNDPGMNSFNHYGFGSVGDWMYQTIGGIVPDPSHPGYKQFSIHPQPGGGLTHASTRYQSAYGLIESRWTKTGGQFTLHAGVPANTAATIYVPASSPDTVTAPGGAHFLRMDNGFAVYSAGSGTYTFVSR